ncbi:MAG: NUDIX hydrolase [Hyphomicrobiaceae bacterium]|nr:NUDIX hydrolase [Hyphomicrobiaceae bacterium]
MASDTPHPTQSKPADAATFVIVDDQYSDPRILMGRRRSTEVFLPDKFVFPGGRVDPDDHFAPFASDLDASELRKLLVDMKGGPSPARARAIALAAVRETFEEAGLLLGVASRSAPEPAGLDSLGDPWRAFLRHEVMPDLKSLRLLARAITPPGRPRRYDTRFFIGSARLIARRTAARDDELSDLDWFTIPQLRRLDLPNITRAVVEDLAQFLALPPETQHGWKAPYYCLGSSSLERTLITCSGLVGVDTNP